MSALVARRPHHGTVSGYKPNDLRTEIAPRPVGTTESDATKVSAIVEARCGADAARVLDILGLAGAS